MLEEGLFPAHSGAGGYQSCRRAEVPIFLLAVKGGLTPASRAHCTAWLVALPQFPKSAPAGRVLMAYLSDLPFSILHFLKNIS